MAFAVNGHERFRYIVESASFTEPALANAAIDLAGSRAWSVGADLGEEHVQLGQIADVDEVRRCSPSRNAGTPE